MKLQDLQKDILSGYEIKVRSYKDNLITDIPDFLKKIDKITKKREGSIIQLLDSDYLCGKMHLNQAIAQAIKAFDEKQNFANDKGLEICVRASAQKQISQAIKILGIKEKSDITVVYIDTSDSQVAEVEKLLGTRCDFLLEDVDEKLILKTYNLKDGDNMLLEINEKIALLSLKS